MYFFFFSSRRRHTRFDCDWSSDVCSSDLQNTRRRSPVRRDVGQSKTIKLFLILQMTSKSPYGSVPLVCPTGSLTFQVSNTRSEERRVGKECRSRWSPYH